MALCIDSEVDFGQQLKETYEIIFKDQTISKKALFGKSSLATNDFNKCIRYLKSMNLILPKGNLLDMRTVLYTIYDTNISVKDLEAILYDTQ